MKKAIALALALSAGVFVSTLPSEAAIAVNGAQFNGVHMNGIPSPITGLDFTTISHQGLGR
jgi:hypothetical protein